MIAPLGVVVPLVAGLCVQTHPCSARADRGAQQAAPGRPPRHGAQGEEPARSSCLIAGLTFQKIHRNFFVAMITKFNPSNQQQGRQSATACVHLGGWAILATVRLRRVDI
jgi:hypothetical protein